MGAQNIPANYIKPHYSTKLLRSIYNYFVKYYSEEMINKIFNDLDIPKNYFLNDDNWHSNELNQLICEKIIQESGDENVLFCIGKDLLQPQNINFFEYQLLKILPPYILLRNLPIQAAKINNVFRLETLKSKPGYFQFRVVKNIDVQPHPGVFQNTEGCLYAIKEFCKLENFDIQVTADEKKQTVYTIKYTAIRYWLFKILPVFLYIFTSFLITREIIFGQTFDVKLYALIMTILCFTMAPLIILLISKIYNIVKNNNLYYANTKEKNERIYEKTVVIESKLNEELYTKNMCLKLIKATKVDDIIDDSLNMLIQNNKYEKAMVMLASEKNGKIKTVSLRGFDEFTKLNSLELNYPSLEKESLFFANILDNKKSILITDVNSFKAKLKPENQDLINSLSVSSLIVSPIFDSEKRYGLLIVGCTNVKNNLTDSDHKFIDHISSLMSLFFQKAYTLETESTLRLIFEKYVPKNVLKEIDNLKDQNSWRIPPQSKNVASMFIDLKGFTSASENLSPESVFKMLDMYFENIAQIVGDRGGIIDNIIGDEMVVFFPEGKNHKHAADCLLTALEISSSWIYLQENVRKAGLPALSVGIGIHNGTASIGTVGSDIRSNYTCLGDTINTTSRIQKLTRKYFKDSDEVVILASKEIFEAAGVPIRHTLINKVLMRGRAQEMDIILIDQMAASEFCNFLDKIGKVG